MPWNGTNRYRYFVEIGFLIPLHLTLTYSIFKIPSIPKRTIMKNKILKYDIYSVWLIILSMQTCVSTTFCRGIKKL